MFDITELGINTFNQTGQCRFNLILHRRSLDRTCLTRHIYISFENSSGNMLFGSLFVRRGLLLLSTDNMLDCFRQLGNVTALYILTDLCSALQIIKIRILIREHKNCLVIHIRAHQQSLIACIIQVGGNCQDAQANRAGQLTNRGLVDDLIIREVIFPVFEFLADIQIPENNLRDRLNNSSAIYRSIADIPFDILLIIGQECIGIPVSCYVVL